MEDIAENFLDEESGETLEEQSDYQDYYFILTIYETANGKFEETYSYTCAPNGKAQFFHNWSDRNRGKHTEYSDRDYEREKMEW